MTIKRLSTGKYEIRCAFEFEVDAGEEKPTKGEYTIYEDGKIETTCRTCKKQHLITGKFAEKAIGNNDILKNAQCLACWKVGKNLEEGAQRDERNKSFSKRAAVGQAINLAVRTGKGPKDITALDKLIVEWLEFTEKTQDEYA